MIKVHDVLTFRSDYEIQYNIVYNVFMMMCLMITHHGISNTLMMGTGSLY